MQSWFTSRPYLETHVIIHTYRDDVSETMMFIIATTHRVKPVYARNALPIPSFHHKNKTL